MKKMMSVFWYCDKDKSKLSHVETENDNVWAWLEINKNSKDSASCCVTLSDIVGKGSNQTHSGEWKIYSVEAAGVEGVNILNRVLKMWDTYRTLGVIIFEDN